jgi:hypothetical protein
MIVETSRSLRNVLMGLALLLPLACGKSDAGASAPDAKSAEPASKSAAKVAPYTYPAPVSGHYAEINTGDFDLVDGFAYASAAGGGTVVYVTSKAIASPILAASACPMTEARSIGLLRDAAYLEVMIDADGKSSYFAQGTPLGGRGREEDAGGEYWKIVRKNPAAGHVAASVAYKQRGGFEFDLPIAKPKAAEVSEGERVQGHRVPDGAPTPAESAVVDAYRALHKAARSKDLAALLAAQGFSTEASAAIRGLAEIDADFTRFTDRFLDPGDPGEATVYEGYGGIRASGVNSKGEKYSNFYEFAPVDGRLVLIGISEDEL